MKIKPNILNSEQKNILKQFIKSFLPKRGNKRKSSGNEIAYIHSVLSRVFKKNFDFVLSWQNIIDAFEELQYDIYHKKGYLRSNDGFSKIHDNFYYIDIDPKLIRQLLLTRMTLPAKTKEEKVLIKNEMVKKIESFKKNYIK